MENQEKWIACALMDLEEAGRVASYFGHINKWVRGSGRYKRGFKYPKMIRKLQTAHMQTERWIL